jgi:hypothetical protein
MTCSRQREEPEARGRILDSPPAQLDLMLPAAKFDSQPQSCHN